MPDLPEPKVRPHPYAEFYREPMLRAMHGKEEAPAPPVRRAPASHRYAELHVTSNYTFLTGASHPEELVEAAAALGHEAVAITDTNTLGGIVRAHLAAKECGMPLVIGCRLTAAIEYPDTPRELSLLVYPTDAAAYGRLSRLLTLGKRRAPKGECTLTLHDVLAANEGLLAIVLPPAALDHVALETLAGLRSAFDDDRLSLAVSRLYGGDDRERVQQLASLAEHTGIPLVVTNDVHYHTPARRPLQDVLTCIRHGCTIEQAGLRLFPNAERCLKSPGEMARLFADHPQALARTVEIAQRASGFNLDQLRYQYPDEVCPPGVTPMAYLTQLTHRGALERYPGGVPADVRARIEHELKLIDELNYAPYFLTVHDLVRFARSAGILCQGRGAAANSAVCYALGVTAVDPDRIDLLFERFISKERNEPPDIDIDFEHERREEVIQYIYRKYGRDRAALTAEVITYRGRSAMRDVGKALGLSLDCVDRLAKDIDWWSDQVNRDASLRAMGLDPREPTLKLATQLAGEIMGFPRHRSQHVGGFVITRGPLCEMVPIENAAMPDRTIIEWDKDDVDAMGMLKVDCLGLGMLTCIRKSFDFLRQQEHDLTLATVPAEDPAVYDMICEADTVGVFQVESRAQMSMLPRLKPRTYYDLVIEVAIVRPGPIQGDMVHPYLRRRCGEEPVDYPSEEVKRVLQRTLGVPLFQEQAMALAIVAAGFSAGEADQLRRAMAAWKRDGNKLRRFESRFIGGMLERGYQREYAERCFQQLQGFSEYGFPESHAASFALLVYVSSWLKRHHPAVFAAALLNSQPMGFYAPAQIVRDAQQHGVEVRPVDVNHSAWDCTIEIDPDRAPALRLGMRLVRGLSQKDAELVASAAAAHGPFRSIAGLYRASGVRASALRRLASADGFGSMGLTRQAALWHVRALRDETLPMFEGVDAPAEPPPRLPAVSAPRRVIQDYGSIGLSLKAHPMTFLREMLDKRRVLRNQTLADERACPHGLKASVAGLVLVRQRPGTASGLIFMTIEDETGTANLIIRPHIFERYRRAARHGVAVIARGTVERQGKVVHIVVTAIESLDETIRDLIVRPRDFH